MENFERGERVCVDMEKGGGGGREYGSLYTNANVFPSSNFPSNVGGGSEIPFKGRPLI